MTRFEDFTSAASYAVACVVSTPIVIMVLIVRVCVNAWRNYE